MLVDHARTPVNGGDNCDRELVWKRKAECIGSGDELVDVALWVGFVDVVSAKESCAVRERDAISFAL